MFGKTLTDGRNDFSDIDIEDENIRWCADAFMGHIYFEKLEVIKHTKCGVWLKNTDHYSLNEQKPKWRCSAKRAAKTKRAALNHLVARKRSCVAHNERRYKEAQHNLATAIRYQESLKAI